MNVYLTLASFMIASVIGATASADHHLVAKVPSLTLEGAKVIAAAAAVEAKANEWNVIIAICDASGDLKYLERPENVQIASLEIAQRKARTAAMFRRPTKAFNERAKGGDTPIIAVPNVIALEGGLPIQVDGHTIGGVGVSGVQSHQDAQIAQAGIDALLKKLGAN